MYIYICNTNCEDILPGDTSLVGVLRVAIPISAVVGSLRIALVFRLNDNDDQPENLFYISLACLALSYIFFGVFLEDFVASSQKALTESFGFILTVVTFFVSVVSLLADRQSWDKSNGFVKSRIAISLIALMLLLVNPIIGILANILFVPAALLYKTPQPKIHFDE